MKIRTAVRRMDGNHHGPGGSVRKWAISLVPLGRGPFPLGIGRTTIGRRLYFYGPTGANIYFDLLLAFDHCPYPEGHIYAPKRCSKCHQLGAGRSGVCPDCWAEGCPVIDNDPKVICDGCDCWKFGYFV